MHRSVLLWTLLGWFLVARPAVAEKTVTVSRIVAVVDDEPLTWQKLRVRVAQMERRLPRSERGRTPRDREALVQSTLSTMVEEMLIAHGADRARISVTIDEIDRAVQLVASNGKLTLAALTTALEQQGMTMVEYRDELRRERRRRPPRVRRRARARRGRDGTPGALTVAPRHTCSGRTARRGRGSPRNATPDREPLDAGGQALLRRQAHFPT